MKKKLLGTGILCGLALCCSLLQLPTVAGIIRPFSAFISGKLNFLTALLPFSLASVLIPLYIIGTAAQLFRSFWKRNWAGLLPIFNGFLVIYSSFMLLFGYAYHLPPVSNALPYHGEMQPFSVLQQVSEQLIAELNAAAAAVARTPDGIVDFPDFDTQIQAVNKSYRSLMDKYAFTLSPYPRRAKSAGYLSVPLSYGGIAGFYFPFTAEANVSRDTVPTHIPFHIAHEVAHVLGVAREDEAGFFAFLSCMESGDPALQYSALLNGYSYAINAVYYANSDICYSLMEQVNPLAQKDLERLHTHLAAYETPVKQVSNAINDRYLKSNGQDDGVESYGFMVDLLISYYLEK